MCEHLDQVFKMLKMFTILGTDLLSIWGTGRMDKGKPNTGINNGK